MIGRKKLKRIYIWIVIVTLLISITACAEKEQPGGQLSQKINLIFEKGIEIVENKEILSEEECERIFISDTQFVEIHYENMNLPKSIIDSQVDDAFYYDYYKKDIEKMISNEEMAKDIALVFLKPYFGKFLGENIYFSVQYIPDYGYYYIFLNDWSSAFGYSVELVLDEKDGKVVYLWDIDPSLG